MNNPYNNPSDERSNKMHAHIAEEKRIEALISLNEILLTKAKLKVSDAKAKESDIELRIAELHTELANHWAGNDNAWDEILERVPKYTAVEVTKDGGRYTVTEYVPDENGQDYKIPRKKDYVLDDHSERGLRSFKARGLAKLEREKNKVSDDQAGTPDPQ